jgi:type I restriction enzyme M protein
LSKDASLEDSDNLPAPEVIAMEIVENLEATLDQFKGIIESLEGSHKAER